MNCLIELKKTVFSPLILIASLTLAFLFLPLNKIKWGKMEFLPAKTITVVGEAETKEKNQIATFSAGVYAVSDSKDQAIKEVNQKVAKIIEEVKNFGIEDNDLKTTYVNIYQQEETYWEEGKQKSRPGQWRASNEINIILRQVDKSSTLAELLAKSGATNIYGPNFSLEDTKAKEEELEELLDKALKDAQRKAELMANSTGVKVKKIISVTEGVQAGRVFYGERFGGGGGGMPIEPGASKVQKNVTVVFEIE